MSGKPPGSSAAPLHAPVGWGGLLFVLVAGLVWWWGVQSLDTMLGVETQCEDTPNGSRGAELAETVRCSIAAGFAGWLYLAWLLVFPFGLVTWLERRLRKAMLARRNGGRRG